MYSQKKKVESTRICIIVRKLIKFKLNKSQSSSIKLHLFRDKQKIKYAINLSRINN
jgi:hypothetical protein